MAIDPVLGYGGIKLGGALLGALGGDPNEQLRKLQEQMLQMQMAQRQQGFDTIQGEYRNPQGYQDKLLMSLAPYFNRIGRNASMRSGLDSGNAQGELARSQQGAMAGGMMERDKTLLQILSQYR